MHVFALSPEHAIEDCLLIISPAGSSSRQKISQRQKVFPLILSVLVMPFTTPAAPWGGIRRRRGGRRENYTEDQGLGVKSPQLAGNLHNSTSPLGTFIS